MYYIQCTLWGLCGYVQKLEVKYMQSMYGGTSYNPQKAMWQTRHNYEQ